MDAQTTITDEALAGSIASAFEDCFASFDTVLVGGAEDPLYRTSQGDEPAKLVFREDFPASALHEIAHCSFLYKTTKMPSRVAVRDVKHACHEPLCIGW